MSKCNQRIANQQKYIGNTVVNHKVEQILRAILLGADYDPTTFTLLNVYSCHGMLQADTSLSEFTIVRVGNCTSDGEGWAFTPVTNSALIMLGLNPNALLLRLNAIVVEDVAALVSSNDSLVCPYGAVVGLAYTVSYKDGYNEVLKDYEQYKSVYGIPEWFSVGVKS